MEPLNVLNRLQIASPCPASWEGMKGDDRVRFCESCVKHVYNVAELTAAEAVRVIEESEGHPCMTLYRRKDGTVLTADCPVGLRFRLRRRMLRLMTAGVLVSVGIQSAVWAYARGVRPSTIPSPPTGPGVTIGDWSNWALSAVGIRRAPAVCIMGEPVAVPAPPSAAIGGIRGKIAVNPVVEP